MKKFERILTILVSFLVIGGSFFVGYEKGVNARPEVEKVTTLINKEAGKPDTTDFSLFWQAWNILSNKYVEGNGTTTSSSTKKVVTDEQKVWGAISGLTKSLGDPYTVFLPPAQSKIFESEISGNFEGVGMEIGIRDNSLVVVAPLKNTPAERAGVLSGDRIVKIDGEPSIEFSVDEAVSKIRGPKGSVVTISISREGTDNLKEIKITRDVINIPTLDVSISPPHYKPKENPDKDNDGLRDDGVFVIRLFNFGATSPEMFRNSLEKFAAAKTDKLLLDLRGNPGGYLEAAVDMASWFLPSDKPVVIERGQGQSEKIHRSKGYNIFNDNLRMVIIVDKGSASASEILAGALQEYKKATIIGEKTFGKGSVQELVKMGSESSLKVTIARWYTPEGRSISQNGLTPDVLVGIKREDVEQGKDPQFEKGIEILTAKK